MTPLRNLPLALVVLAVLPAASPGADPMPDGARLRLGSGHFRHGAAVSRIYPLPDGKRLLTFAHDSKARVWDIAAEKLLVEIALAPQPSVGLVFSVSHDGKTLASANTLDRTIRVWNLSDGTEAIAFGGLAPNQGFLDLEYSADGKLLVSSHQDRTYRVWDPVAAKEVRQIGVPAVAAPGRVIRPIGRVNFTPDAKGLTVIEDWAVRVLDAEDGKELRWFGGHVGQVASYAFSPDGKRLATVASDRAARLWDLGTGKTVAKFPLPQLGGREVAFSADGKTLAVACNDRAIRLFDVASARETAKIDLAPGSTLGTAMLALSPDGKTVYSSNNESVLHGYDAATGKDRYPVVGHAEGVAALAWSPDGKRLVTCGSAGDRSIVVWDAASGKLLHQLPPLEGYFFTTHLQFGPDGKTFLTYGTDRTVRAWDMGEGKELQSFVVAPVQPQSFALSSDGKLAAAACPDRTVRVWDVAAEKELHVLEMKPAAAPNNFFFGSVSFAGDNRTLTVYSTNERLTARWDALTGKELGEVKGANLPIPLVGQSAHTADGRGVMVLQGTTVNLTELATGKVRQSFALPQPPPPPPGVARVFVGTNGAALAPDGRTAATLTGDGKLLFWDCGTGKMLVERKGLPVGSRLAAFSPDGKALATAGADSGALLWDVPGPDAKGRPAVEDVTAATAAELWKDVSGEDASRAWQAILTLAASPKEAVPFVRKQLKPEAAPEAKQVAKWIADLDAEAFQEREDATEALVRAGAAAEDAVRKALGGKPSAEARQRLEFIVSKMSGSLGPNMEDVRATRAVEVLEKIGTPEARQALEEAAKGAEGHLTAEARSALARLKAR
jgi:WD40 repeat protein